MISTTFNFQPYLAHYLIFCCISNTNDNKYTHIHKVLCTYRCDGKLWVTVFEKPDGLYGCLKGLHSNDVAYAQQAATDVEITIENTTVSAEIINYGVSKKGSDVVNFRFHDKERLYMLKSKIKGKFQLTPVHFILKHPYFLNLHKSLDRVTTRIIECLIPHELKRQIPYELKRQSSPPIISMRPSDRLLLDEEYQRLALEKMMACDFSVPFLVTGPFGTGKTRLLAAAAVNFLRDHNNRVLICTSHLQSADAYIDDYFGPLKENRQIPYGVEPIRLVSPPTYRYTGKYRDLFKAGFDSFKECRLIITTFLTAPKLIRMNIKPFTHILIDEGAQTREPEAIAPLGLADDNTKIVIAGDHLQVKYLLHAMLS